MVCSKTNIWVAMQKSLIDRNQINVVAGEIYCTTKSSKVLYRRLGEIWSLDSVSLLRTPHIKNTQYASEESIPRHGIISQSERLSSSAGVSPGVYPRRSFLVSTLLPNVRRSEFHALCYFCNKNEANEQGLYDVTVGFNRIYVRYSV